MSLHAVIGARRVHGSLDLDARAGKELMADLAPGTERDRAEIAHERRLPEGGEQMPDVHMAGRKGDPRVGEDVHHVDGLEEGSERTGVLFHHEHGVHARVPQERGNVMARPEPEHDEASGVTMGLGKPFGFLPRVVQRMERQSAARGHRRGDRRSASRLHTANVRACSRGPDR